MKKLSLLAGLVLASLVISCKPAKSDKIIIWSDNAQFASYIEAFNASHNKVKAVLVYKEMPARSLPVPKDELPPDIIIGPWLKNASTKKYFRSVDYLLQGSEINRSFFYPQLMEYGRVRDNQLLLPVSFNLPAVIFSTKNDSLMGENSKTLNLQNIESIAAQFNAKNKSDAYTSMGFGPSWDSEFLYLVTKLKGANFREKGTSFSYDSKSMLETVQYLKEWSLSRNTDTTTEQNFQFKYLYMPEHKQVSTGHCLFASMTSDQLFSLSVEQISGISFRWIFEDGFFPVEDNIVTMGIYKKSSNISKAEVFVSWFLNEKNQEKLLERTDAMKLDDKKFGIAGGFSSIINVNEKFYPIYWHQLMGNLPEQDKLKTPNILPYHWPSLKEKVIYPYLQDSIDTNRVQQIEPLEDRIAEWSKQY